jgi:phospholipid/cholesterol/gamma-HCH transport system ATP-binding protein
VTTTLGARRVLDDVSFTIPAGRTLCLLGRSGTGKSVTLKHIARLLHADEGAVRVFGQDVGPLHGSPLSALRRRMGFLFQHAALFDSTTVGENVAFPLRRHTRLPESEIVERARALLDRVGLAREYPRMPGELSGGMRKRAALARALVLEPELLLIDEPSAGLDPITSAEIDDLLLEVKSRATATLVIVTHNLPSARKLGDELAFLHEGRFVASGTYGELVSSQVPIVRHFFSMEGTG